MSFELNEYTETPEIVFFCNQYNSRCTDDSSTQICLICCVEIVEICVVRSIKISAFSHIDPRHYYSSVRVLIRVNKFHSCHHSSFIIMSQLNYILLNSLCAIVCKFWSLFANVRFSIFVFRCIHCIFEQTNDLVDLNFQSPDKDLNWSAVFGNATLFPIFHCKYRCLNMVPSQHCFSTNN